jgi:LEA14-like dessication related protein
LDIRILEVLIILLFVIAGLLLGEYFKLKNQLKKVEISLDEVKTDSLKYKEGNFNIRLIAKNSNNKTVFLRQINYAFYGNNYEIGKGTILFNSTILPEKAIELNASIQAKNSSAAGQIWASNKWRAPVCWRVEGTVYFDSIFGSINLPFYSQQG